MPVKRLLPHGLIMAAAVFATPSATPPSKAPVMLHERQADPRLAQLHHFFDESRCPATRFAEDFLREADAHNLDWRLLPSISLVESGGGRESRRNNIFGWDSGKASFPSITAGIHYVADRLETSDLYKDKDLDEILWTYNPRAEYVGKVKTLMARMRVE